MKSNGQAEIANLKRYLLGGLSPEENEVVGYQVIAGEISEEKLLWAENELIEDYLDQTLTPAETAMFESDFLVSPERAAHLKQIALIRNYARNSAAKTFAEKEFAAPETLLAQIKVYFRHHLRPAIAAFALVLLGLAAVFYLTANRRTTAENELAAVNRQDLSNLDEFKPLTNLSLMNGVFRDAAEISKLKQSALTDKVLLRLALPVKNEIGDKFKAEFVKNQKVILMLDNLPFYVNPNGQEMRLLVPSGELQKGNYQIKLTKMSGGETNFVYRFEVE